MDPPSYSALKKLERIWQTHENWRQKFGELNLLTRWCWKKVDKEIQAKPMWLKIWMTLLAEPPANKIAKQRRKFPAGILVPGMYGWLYQTFSFSGHFGFWHRVVTTAMVPTSRLSSRGLSALQAWQNWNRRSSLEKNTMCLDSTRWLSYHELICSMCKLSTYSIL